VGIKKGIGMSHRSTAYPCSVPSLGEFSRSWSHPFARHKGIKK